MSEEKNLGGRPALWEDPEELRMEIDKYFAQTKKLEESPTITGLCLFLGFESRQSFYDYEKKEGFSYTIKRARLMIENHYESRLLFKSTVTGAIFALKNFGWADKQEIDHTSNGNELKGFTLNIKPDGEQ